MSKLTSEQIQQFSSLNLSADISGAIKISETSQWRDEIWYFDINVPGRVNSTKLIKWAQKLPDSSLLTDEQNAYLLESCRRFIWSLRIDPPAGKKKVSFSSLPEIALNLFVFLRWMIANGYRHFHQIGEVAIENYIAYYRTRNGKSGKPLTTNALLHPLQVIEYLYKQRNKLPDAIMAQPFDGDSASIYIGYKFANEQSIPYIPDDIAIDIIGKAIKWVESYAKDIFDLDEAINKIEYEFAIRKICYTEHRKKISHLFRTFTFSKLKDLNQPWREPLRNKHELNFLLDRLIDACYIVIAGLTGMRVSEILSLQVGCLAIKTSINEHHNLSYLCGRTYKTAIDRQGQKTKWVAPEPVNVAVNILEQLSQPFREKSGKSDLFLLLTYRTGEIGVASRCVINSRINKFAKFIGVPLFQGSVWQFSTHQFRKTFARFVGRRDKTSLYALAQHFKHVSIAMTDHYVGTDHDLMELIGETQIEEMRAALDVILGAEALAGKAGQEIVARNFKFRGRAGNDVRRDMVDYLLNETDLTIYMHSYGFCVFRPESALCGGNRACIGHSVCINCQNFIVSEEHRPFWENHKNRNLELLQIMKEKPPLFQQPVKEEIETADRILVQLGGLRGKYGS